AQIFMTENSKMLPYAGSGDALNFWVNKIKKYGVPNNLRTCPETTGPYNNKFSTSTTSWIGASAGNDPDSNPPQPYVGSYCINSWAQAYDPTSDVLKWANQGSGWAGGADGSYFWSFPFAVAPFNIPLFGDGVTYDAWPHTSDTPPANLT